MSARHIPSAPALVLVALLLLPAGGAAAVAATVCDSDPDAVGFEATVDPTKINALLAALGQLNVDPGGGTLTVGGFCVDHQVDVDAAFFSFPVDGSPFTVTPSPGSIMVDLDVLGPFGIGIDGSGYQSVNCSSSCKVSLPYVGEVFDGCSIEAGIVGPVLGLLDASATWDSLHVKQIADTCVLGSCEAVSPLEFSDASLSGFDVDLTGFGSCPVSLDFPDPLPDPPSFDPCDGIDPLLTSLIASVIDGALDNAFKNQQGEGVLINALSMEILKDFGCLPIPEVAECKAGSGTPATSDLGLGRESRYANLALGLIPVLFALGLTRSLRRRT
jgi:hypothetical protein